MLYLLDVSQYYGYLKNQDSHSVIEENAKRTAMENKKIKKVSCQLIIPNTQHPAGVAGIRRETRSGSRFEQAFGLRWAMKNVY